MLTPPGPDSHPVLTAGTVGGVEALLLGLGASAAAARSLAHELVARHNEGHRRYHSVDHVTEVLAEADRLLRFEAEADPAAVELAVWFHDAIYDPAAGPGQSEAASADLAVDRLAALARADRDRLAHEVARLVRLTERHLVEPADRSGAVVVDADLWVLSSTPERYDRYATDVRAEYAYVPDEAWVSGRASVLTLFLTEMSDLYTAGPDDDRHARRARAAGNLRRELAWLRPQPT